MSEITEVTHAKKFEAAPGTEILVDEDQNGYTHTLQHLKKGDGHVLLVPQPSLTDVNDPLRWPAWKKWMVRFSPFIFILAYLPQLGLYQWACVQFPR